MVITGCLGVAELIWYFPKKIVRGSIKEDHVLGKVFSAQSKGHFNSFFHEPVHPQCELKRTSQ